MTVAEVKERLRLLESSGLSVEDARVPGGVPPAELQEYLRDLVRRLTRLAYPDPPER